MRRTAVVALFSSGCFISGHHHNTAYHLNGAMAAVGTFLLIKAPGARDCMGLDNTPPPLNPTGDGWTPYRECRDNNQTRNLMNGIGGGLVLAALVGTLINYTAFHGVPADDSLHPNDESQIQTEVDLLDIGSKDPRLVQLTKEAAFAARKDNCRVVRLIYQRVRVIDSEYAATGFIKDNTIERCVNQLDTQ
jgi:hypothetical protein